jgi:chemotaxis protein CheD
VECVIPEMIRQLQGQGVAVTELEVKLFGGADMMMAGLATHQRVGRSNVQMAKTLLAKMGITLKSSDTGGTVGRKLIFNTATGDVWIKRLNQSR